MIIMTQIIRSRLPSQYPTHLGGFVDTILLQHDLSRIKINTGEKMSIYARDKILGAHVINTNHITETYIVFLFHYCQKLSLPIHSSLLMWIILIFVRRVSRTDSWHIIHLIMESSNLDFSRNMDINTIAGEEATTQPKRNYQKLASKYVKYNISVSVHFFFSL